MLNLMVDPPARIVGKRQLAFSAPSGRDARASSFLDDRLGLMRVLGRSSQNPPRSPAGEAMRTSGRGRASEAPGAERATEETTRPPRLAKSWRARLLPPPGAS